MALIRKIIDWLKKLFRRLFKHDKKRINKGNKRNNKTIAKKYVNGKIAINDSLPDYLIISNKDKEKLIYSISVMLKMLGEQHTNQLEKIENEIINIIKNNDSVNKRLLVEIINEEKILDDKSVNLLIRDFNDNEKKVVLDKYQIISERNKDFKVHMEEAQRVLNLIDKNAISIIEEDEIDREINNLNDKNNQNIVEKIDKFNKRVLVIIDNIDNDFLNAVLKEYNTVNYVTVSTVIIDKNYEILKKLEDDYKNHRFNKFYYEREIAKIKHEMKKLKDLKNTKEVSDHIEKLRKELYTKSKDKYDLLYNNEFFINFNGECDKLLEKINTKVIDIKKEEPKVEKKEENNEYIKKILLRFQDMRLARNLILENSFSDESFSNQKDIINYVNEMYDKFNAGIDNDFNYNSNKTKAELVILYNDLNFVISKVEKEPYVFVDHINFRMNDLIEASMIRKKELSNILRKNDIISDDTLIDEKMELLTGKDNKKNKVLKKEKNTF